jgi:L-alanine-DL-glutamate epimerase-like enolase superfamily enzyme
MRPGREVESRDLARLEKVFPLVITNANLLSARAPVGTAPALLLRLTTDAGASAWAEVAAEGEAAQVAEELGELLPLVLERDPLERGALWERLALAVEWPGTPEATGAALVSALDLALWDLAAQAAGLPLYALLGGRYLRQVDTYALYDAAGEGGREAPPGGVLVEAGGDWERAVWRVEDLRRRWGDGARLWVDFGEGLREGASAAPLAVRLQAAEVFCWLDPFPAGYLREYQELARSAEVPLGAGATLTGQKGCLRLLEGRFLDLLALDVRRCGGLTGAQRLAHLAGAYQLPVALRGGRWAPTLLAVAHLASTSGVYLPVARAEGMGAGDGFVRLPEEPGLGAQVSEGVLAGYDELEVPE